MTQALQQPNPDRLLSAPVYADLVPFDGAHFHLLVAQASSLDAAAPFIARLAQQPEGLQVLCLGSKVPLAVDATFTTSETDLSDQLKSVLAASTAGTRLYLAGDEAFIWRMQRVARDTGLLRDEIAAMATQGHRAVFCVHCASTHDYDPADEVTCAHCRVRLGVRGHFSERLGAWLGVCANADDPYTEAQT